MSGATESWLPDRYRLLEKLGAGGMGEVWLAEDLQLRRRIAVKRLLLAGGAAGEGETDRRRFKREFLILSRLQSPGIVRVYEQGDGGGGLYYTMEHVEGWLLKDYFSGGHWRGEGAAATPLYHQDAKALERVLRAGEELLKALAHLHAQALVHRDLKPGNVLIARDRSVKLIDFGLAREQQAELVITQTGEVLGTPNYLAPEQIRSQPLDGRADLYALGVILYEMMTGGLPFTATGVAEVLMAHLQQAPLPPRQLNPAISPAAGAFILRLLAKEPGGRFASALEALRALQDAERPEDSQTDLTTQLGGEVTASLPAAGVLVAPYVGNEAARGALLAACRALPGGAGGVLLISGPSGAGKSRLKDEVRACAVEHGVKVLAGGAPPGGGAAGQMFQELFAQLADELARRPERAAQWPADAAAALAARFPALRRVAAFAALPAPPPLAPEAEKSRLFTALYQVFAARAALSPLLLWLDDLQWADPLSLELIAHLIHSFTGEGAQPQLLLAGNHRDGELSADAAKWLGRLSQPQVKRIALQPLGVPELGRLVQGLLGLAAPPPERFSRRLHELTGGNPYFATETVKGLVAEGTLKSDGREGWNFSEWADDELRSGHISLPGSVQAVLAQRLGEVDEAARGALQAAAVIGRQFKFSWWRQVTGLGEDALLEIAENALRAGLLLEAGRDSLRFNHDQLRAALLSGLSALKTRRLHEKITAAVAALEKIDDHLELLAEHAVAAQLRDEAVRYGHPAVEHLYQAFQCDEALRLLERIGGLFSAREPMPDGALQAHYRLKGNLLNKLTESKAGIAFYPEALALARRLGSEADELQYTLQLGNSYHRNGEHERSVRAYEAGVALAERMRNPARKGSGLYGIASGLMTQGRLAEARATLLKALDWAQSAGDLQLCGNVNSGLGLVCYLEGDLVRAAEHFRAAILMWEKTGNRGIAVMDAGNLAEIMFYLGQLDDAEAELKRARAANQAMGGRSHLIDNLNNLGQCRLQRGDLSGAERTLHEALRLSGQIGDREKEMDGRIHLARVLSRMERWAEADGEITAMLRIAEEMGNRPKQARAAVVRAEIAWRRGDPAGAAAFARDALALAEGKFKESHALALALRHAAEAAGGLLDDAGFARSRELAGETRSFELVLLVDLLHAGALLAAGRASDAGKLLEPALERARGAGFALLAGDAEALPGRSRTRALLGRDGT